MDPIRRTRDLGRRYLDGLASAAEVAELEHLLQGSPAAADAFAHLTRLEADLSALFSEEPGRRRQAEMLEAIERDQRRRRWRARGIRLALAASLFLLVGGPLLWWLGQPATVVPGSHTVLEGQVLAGDTVVERLRDGDLVSVLGRKPALLRLADGSRARLEPNSRVLLHGSAPGLAQWIDLLAGAGRFTVSPGGEAFRVDTPIGRVTALGTEFTVQLTKADEGDREMMQRTLLGVIVFTGLVQVEVSAETHFVAAGESRVFGARDQREDKRPRAARTLFGAVTQVKDGKLSVALGRRTLPVVETFTVGPKVKVLVDGKPGKLADLAKDMAVRLEMDDKDALLAVLAEGPTIGGTVKEVADGKITLAGGGRGFAIEEDTTYKVSSDAKVTIDGKPARLTDLKAGTRIMLRMSADRKAVVMILQPGRREGLPSVSGMIKAIDVKAGTVTLTVGRGGEERTLTLGKEVKVTIEGKQVKVADLKANSPALLRLAADRTVLAITVGGARRTEARGIQGKVSAVQGSKLTLQAGRRDAGSEETFEVGASVRVFVDRKPAKLSDLTKGMLVRLLKEKDVLIAIHAEGPTLSGTVKALAGGKLTLAGAGRRDSDEGQTFDVAEDAKVVLDGKEVKVADLKPGTRVSLVLSADGKKVLAIRSMERGRASAIVAEVKAIDVKEGTITLRNPRGGDERTLALGKEVKVTIDGKDAALADLKAGSTVVLTLDRDGKTVQAIAVRGRPGAGREGEKRE